MAKTAIEQIRDTLWYIVTKLIPSPDGSDVSITHDALGDIRDMTGDLATNVSSINTYKLVAIDNMTKQSIEQGLQEMGINIPVVVKTPITIAENNLWTQSNIRLCWLDIDAMEIEAAPLSFYVDASNGTVFLYARGISGIMAGILGRNEEWGNID